METNLKQILPRLQSMDQTELSSAANPIIRELCALSKKKARDESGCFLVEGAHMIEEALEAGLLKAVFLLKSDKEQKPDSKGFNMFQKSGQKIPVIFCAKNALDKLSALTSKSSQIGLCIKPELQESEKSRILMLENVQDPGNVGTLIRSAYSFGADLVFLSKTCADPYSPKVLQSSQGAIFHIPVMTGDFYEAEQDFRKKQIPVYAAALHHDSIALSQIERPEKYAVMIGNEGSGLSDQAIELASEIIHIEMSAFESLNAAIAGSIILYAFQPEQS